MRSVSIFAVPLLAFLLFFYAVARVGGLDVPPPQEPDYHFAPAEPGEDVAELTSCGDGEEDVEGASLVTVQSMWPEVATYSGPWLQLHGDGAGWTWSHKGETREGKGGTLPVVYQWIEETGSWTKRPPTMAELDCWREWVSDHDMTRR